MHFLITYFILIILLLLVFFNLLFFSLSFHLIFSRIFIIDVLILCFLFASVCFRSLTSLFSCLSLFILLIVISYKLMGSIDVMAMLHFSCLMFLCLISITIPHVQDLPIPYFYFMPSLNSPSVLLLIIIYHINFNFIHS